MDRLFAAFLFGLFIGLMAGNGTKFIRVLTVSSKAEQQGHGDGKSTHAPTETLKIVGREDIGA